VAAPHSEQVTLVSTCPLALVCFALHLLQCFGSCWNPFSLKNSCSPALKTNSSPQSTHFNDLSVNSMGGLTRRATSGHPETGAGCPDVGRSNGFSPR
jgi:hypothetical protein